MYKNLTKKLILCFMMLFLISYGSIVNAESCEDLAGPIMTEFCLEENGETLKAGDTFHVTAKWEDESNVAGVTAFWDGTASGSGGIFTFEYNEETELWECEHTFSENEINGEYCVSSIWAHDEWGNRSESYYPKEKVTFSGGVNDVTGPVMTEFCIKENGETLEPGDIFHVTAKWEDTSGVASVTAFWDGTASGSGGIFTFEYNEETELWECEHTFSEKEINGEYCVSSIWAHDEFGNRSESYYPKEKVTFVGGVDDVTGPVMTEFCMKECGNILKIGETFHVTAKWEDESDVTGVTAFWDGPGSGSGGIFTFEYNEETGLWECEHTFSEADMSGKYYVSSIWAHDEFGNRSDSYYPKEKVFLEKDGHSLIEHAAKNATCTENGWKTYKTCEYCEYSTYNEIEALGHKYTNVCDKTCNRCNATRTVAHRYKTTTAAKATLSKNGKKVTACTVCGNESGKATIYKPTSFKLSYTKCTYSGKVKKPSVTVKDAKGNVLEKDVDYKVEYSSGRKNTGKYTVTIKFKGDYSGEKKLTFKILPSKTSKITVTSTTSTLKVAWKKVTGASGYKVQLLSSDGKVLKTKHTTDVKTTFKELSKATTYKVKVTAYKIIDETRNYSLSSKIMKTATAPSKPTGVKATAGTKKATLSWKKVTGTGYEIVYDTNSKFSSPDDKIAVTGSSTVKKTIKGLKKGKIYYFKIRAYKMVDGVKVYGNYSEAVRVKIK